MSANVVNTFAGSPLDRAGDRRNDPDWLDEQTTNPEAVAMMMWDGKPLVEEATTAEPRLAWLSLDQARATSSDRDVFLGLREGAPIFAVEVEGAADPTAGPLKGLGRFVEMREAGAMLSGAEAAMAATARSLFEWRARHGFCAACGVRSQTRSGGWKRTCPACGVDHFPRVDPVTIMLAIHKGPDGDRCLLGRQAAWPAGRMSALAGFIEPGESIEEGCAREIAEEAGLKVKRVTYHSSQPWPFPSQLMIGLFAEVEDDDARPDQTELEAVVWLKRAEMSDVLEGRHPSIVAPPPIAISRALMQAWVDGFDP